MSDFTKAQAAKWIAQELASCAKRGENPKTAADAYETEGKMFAEMGMVLPIADEARVELVKQLRAL